MIAVQLPSRSAEILLVDDSPSDVLLAQEALSSGKLLNNLHVVQDGVEALDFLHRRGEYAAAPRPDLILLDLNLPKKTGHEVLAEIKADPQLRVIPVVVMTSSRAEADLQSAYQEHANCYVTKPLEFAAFIEVVRTVRNFWFNVVTLPSE